MFLQMTLLHDFFKHAKLIEFHLKNVIDCSRNMKNDEKIFVVDLFSVLFVRVLKIFTQHSATTDVI